MVYLRYPSYRHSEHDSPKRECQSQIDLFITFALTLQNVSTVKRKDTFQGSAGHPGIKTVGTRSLTEELCQLRQLLQAEEGPTNFALMAYSSTNSNSSTNSESVIKKRTVETNEPKNARKENGAPIIEDWVSESEEEDVPKVKTIEMFNKPNFAKINFVKSTEQVKSHRKTLVDKNRQNTPSPRGNKRNWNQQMPCTSQISPVYFVDVQLKQRSEYNRSLRVLLVPQE
ncbi:hypothetical protein Tco_1214972 [Tanacetum coccineum]